MRLLACCALAVLLGFLPKDAAAIDTCSGGNRAARKVTCVVDGDTIWQAGVKMRLLDIDTPETSQAQCDRERARESKQSFGCRRLWPAGTGSQTAARRIELQITAALCGSCFPMVGTPAGCSFVKALPSVGRTKATGGAKDIKATGDDARHNWGSPRPERRRREYPPPPGQLYPLRLRLLPNQAKQQASGPRLPYIQAGL
jgi:hypothetical protein